MSTMARTTIVCLENNSRSLADVLERTRDKLRVVLVGSTVVLDLRRDRRDRFVGRAAGLEFQEVAG